ncbi:MAG: MFS transporter [Pseudomonadota bacterium]
MNAPASSPTPAPSTDAWLPLVLTLAIQAAAAMALLTLPVMAPEVARGLGVSPALVGVYVALTYLGAMTASLAGGVAVMRWGAIRISQWSLVACALGLLLCSVAWLPAIALGAVLIGLGYGPITPASSHLLARTTPAHRVALVFSIKQTGVPVGGILAGAIVPSLMLWLQWQASLAVVAAACLVFALASQPLRASLDADRRPEHAVRWASLLAPLRMVLAHPPLALMAACSFLMSMMQMSLGTYLVTYLHEDLAYGLVGAGLMLSVTQAGGVVGRILWGWIADRGLGAGRTMLLLAVLMTLCALATAGFTPATSRGVVIVVMVLFGASAIGWNGVYLAQVARRAPAGMASMATGGTLAFTFLGVVLGPPLFGALSAGFGTFRAGFLALVGVGSACALLMLWGGRRERAG